MKVSSLTCAMSDEGPLLFALDSNGGIWRCFADDPQLKWIPAEKPPFKTRDSKSGDYTENFEAFWDLYPRSTKKPLTFRSYKSVIKNEESYNSMMSFLERQVEAWGREFGKNKKYIPHSSTWLNNKCWEDCLENINDYSSNDIESALEGLNNGY